MIKAYIASVWPGSATRYSIGGAEARGASHKSWLLSVHVHFAKREKRLI